MRWQIRALGLQAATHHHIMYKYYKTDFRESDCADWI